jgi:oligoendopeptidase F
VNTFTGALDLRKNGSEIFNNPSREVRKQGFRNNIEGFNSRKDLFGFALLETVKGRNTFSRLKGFKDYPDMVYQELLIGKENVLNTLSGISRFAEINKKFERNVIQLISKTNRIDTVHFYDLPSLFVDMIPRFTIDSATSVIKSSVVNLGIEYRKETNLLLDPNNSRLDMVMRPNRFQRGGGFSTGSVGYISTFFQGNYEGYIQDLMVFGHEAGHAVQNMLMESNRVSALYSSGQNFFTESYAGFNELLIMEYLYDHAQNDSMRIYYLANFLNQATQLFQYSHDALFEQRLYDSVGKGVVQTADQIEALMQNTGATFSIWFGSESENLFQWVNRLQFYTRPLYKINYVYSKILSLAYFNMYKKRPDYFIPKYIELLKNGYNNTPNELLKNSLGINVGSPFLVRIKSRI